MGRAVTSILAAIVADTNVSPALRAVLSTPEQIARAASDDYRALCWQQGREPDPVMADETYWRELRRAQGLPHFAGD
jgi:hypothetical protein